MRIIKNVSTLLFTCALAMVFVGCPKTTNVTPQPPVIVDQDKCQAACDNLKALGCVEGQPIDMHTKCMINAECAAGQTCSALGTCITPCVTFCVDTENQGVWLDPVCVSKITTCREIDNCPLAQPKASACNENSCPMPAR